MHGDGPEGLDWLRVIERGDGCVDSVAELDAYAQILDRRLRIESLQEMGGFKTGLYSIEVDKLEAAEGREKDRSFIRRDADHSRGAYIE